MKLKYTLVFSIISFFITTIGFSQKLSDLEIGFDVARTTTYLRERGIAEQNLEKEIIMMREMQMYQYTEMKKTQDIFSQKVTAEKTTVSNALSNSITAKSTFVDIPKTERDALISFYNSTAGTNWRNTINNYKVWDVTNPNSDVSTWSGVSVSNGHVVKIIEITDAIGTIPDMSDLPYLKEFTVFDSKFTGNLTGLQNLTNLEVLRFGWSYIHGNTVFEDLLPITNLINLKEICFSYCSFNNNIIPVEFKKLVNLKKIQFNNGNINQNWELLGDFTDLTFLRLDSNNFSGALPSNFSKLNKLEVFSAYGNLITDISVVSNFKLLKFIDLTRNYNITTPLTCLNELTNLTYISLGNNKIPGTIPSFFANFKLLLLNLDSNELYGQVPTLNFNAPSFSAYIGGSGFYLDRKQLILQGNKFRFIDIVDGFSVYKTNLVGSSSFYYAYQAKINVPETITKNPGQSIDLKMYADWDIRYLADDTYQWFKNGIAITGATSRVYTIPSLLATDAATYICRSYHATNPDMSPLVLEREPITVKVINCTPVTGTLKASTESPAVNANTTFSLETVATGLTYKWTFYNDVNGTTVKDGTQTAATATQSYSVAGSYLVRLEITEANGCTTKFDKLVNVINGCVDSYSPNRNGMINSPYPYGDPSGIILNKPTNLSFYSSSGSTSLSYQWGLLDSNNLLVASGNQAIFPITVTNAGDYKVTLRVSDALGCSSFEINLKTRDGNACVIPEYERGGYIINPTNSEKLLVNTATVLSLSRAGSYITTGFTYKWDLIKLNGEVISSGNEEKFSAMPTEIGDYKINLEVRDPNGCTTDYTRDYKVVDICVFTEDEAGWIGATDEYDGGTTYFVKINESKDFYIWWGYTDISANATYKWSLFNPSGELISTSTNATFSSVFKIPGYHRVELEITNTITGCKRIATKEVGCLIGNSCTELNPKSTMVKDLLNNLIKSLLIRSIKGETDAQINASPTSPEFLALKPYITQGVGNNIYNYSIKRESYSDEYGFVEKIDFSFSPDRLSDIHLEIYDGISHYATSELSDEELSSRLDYDIFIDLSQYISSNNHFTSCRVVYGGKNANTAVRPKECRQESEVRYIDFCPTDCIPTEGTLNVSTETPIINTSTKFSFGTTATNLTYNWTVTNSANVVVETVSNTTGLYSFIANTIGNYTISVKVTNEKKCETEFSKTITAIVPLPIVDCETHFNFNFKIPYITKGGLLNNTERENIANGIIGFVNKNISEKLYLTTYDDHSSGVRPVAVQNKYTTTFPEATTNTSNETQSGFFRIQDDFYSDSFKNLSSGIIANVAITKKIDISFFVISEDNFADITASKAAYANLLNSTKSNKIFFIFLDEGRFRNRTLNTYLSPVEFATQVKGSAAINYAATGNVLTSDFISFSKAQIADAGFKNILSAFLDKSYTQVKSKKCTTASCVTTNPNSQVVKGLFINLVNKLQSLPAGTVINGYTCAELTALTPFITVSNPAIFNYNQGSFSFSSLPNNNDVFMGANAQVTDVNLDSYVDSETETNFIAKYGTIEKGSSVKHINFCPDKLCSSIEGTFKFAPQVLNANVNASFSLETVATNLTYDWTFYNLDNTTELAKATTAAATQAFTAAGRYRIVLNVKDDKGCVTPFENFVTVLPACTPITGVIKIGFGAISTPTTPIPAPTQIYWYQAVHPLDHTGTDFVVYIDGNGVKQTYTLTRTESGYNAPCTEITASSILNHAGAIPCVSE